MSSYGEIVTGIYKTGKYVGKITEEKGDRSVVQVLAVLKHPQQGDLHQGKSAQVPYFHERRALSYLEKTNIPNVYIKAFEGEVPNYEESLKLSLLKAKEELQRESSDYANKALLLLNKLETEYFK
ncbi:sporulation phosphorelay system protein KapB [Evansella cellulosilytica]|uniref:Kinase associated protein B n=1 Tax=Evansella cellulosilytica (strain ATCC 21833 / DSM 2522 / FERM P-1141 / JCM 9156 / N-4) TaxID=649639 RepID=E6TQJ1_EVAC2|nr:sporulation phosphorelay system protein KapB [Evansella cellulosilytica]ADU30502.1 Kinase associated protein B [Evansella cellulosilytica DSM 2522]